MDLVFIKKEYPYNYNENKHKIHLSDREINTIRTVIVAKFLAIKWIQHVAFVKCMETHNIMSFFPLAFISFASHPCDQKIGQ